MNCGKCRLLTGRRRAGIKGLGQQTKTSPFSCSAGEIKRAAPSLIKGGAGRRARSQSAKIQLRRRGAVERCDGEIIVCSAKSLSAPPHLTLSSFLSTLAFFNFRLCSRPPAPPGPAAERANLISRSANSSLLFSVCVTRRRLLGAKGRKRITLHMCACVIYATPSKRDETLHRTAPIRKCKLSPEDITYTDTLLCPQGCVFPFLRVAVVQLSRVYLNWALNIELQRIFCEYANCPLTFINNFISGAVFKNTAT